MNLLYRLLIFSICFLSILYCSSCYKHPEGCTDVNALNFDIEADKDCEKECCKYPKLSLISNIYYDTIKLDTNTIFANDKGDSLRITNFVMLLSQFQLIDKYNELYDLNNGVILGIKEDTTVIYENLNYNSAKISLLGEDSKIGYLKVLDDYLGVVFNFGVDSIVNHSKVDKIAVSSPIYPKKDSIYDYVQQEYYFLKFSINFNNNKSKEFLIKDDKHFTRYEVSNDFDFNERNNHLIKIKINLKKLLQNFNLDTEEEFIEVFLSDFKSYISFEN